MAKFTNANACEIGRRGGQRTAQTHGSDHMRAIGRRGFQRTLEHHWRGDKAAFMDYLTRKGRAAMDPMPYNGAWQNVKPWGIDEQFPDPPISGPDWYEVQQLRRWRSAQPAPISDQLDDLL